MSKKILLSGVKPTGRPHIGNYFGAMKQFVDLQDEFDAHIFIADLHALTTVQDKKKMREATFNLALDYLAIDLKPEKVTLYKQSDVPQVAELAWILNCLTTMPYLKRAHSFKDAEAKNKDINVGVFDYPVLMAADILLPDADIVPVGKDQKQHVEIAREMARKFNQTFGETFKEPEEKIIADHEIIPGTDGKKMSKSYNNTIPLFATDDEIEKAVMSISTDSRTPEEPKEPGTVKLFLIHQPFLGELGGVDRIKEIEGRYKEGGMGYKEAKEILIEDIKTFIKPLREKRERLAQNPNQVYAILKAGAEKMHKQFEQKMNIVRDKTGLSF